MPPPGTAPTIRLHISPLDPPTAPVLLPSIDTSSISFHTLPTFSERHYAFVTVPATIAAATKKRLHGSVFRGQKVCVEEARPSYTSTPNPGNGRQRPKRGKSPKTVNAIELQERRVQRGWGKQDGECLVRIKIPANRMDKDEGESKTKERTKRRKVVKEFERVTKFPSFLKGSGVGNRPLTSEWVEGKGWMDAAGDIVEPMAKKQPQRALEAKGEGGGLEVGEDNKIELVPVGGRSRKEQSVSFASELQGEAVPPAKLTVLYESDSGPDQQPDSGRSRASGLELEASLGLEGSQRRTENTKPTEPSNVGLNSDRSIKSASSSPAATSSRPALKINTLQALYKPTVLTSSASSTETFKFSFGADDSSDDDSAPANPSTPYRDPARYRSAAPTPDTAIATKRFFSPVQPIDIENGHQPLLFPHEDSAFLQGLSIWSRPPPLPSTLKPTNEVTDEKTVWERTFYQNRGEWNREWKQRRRESIKLKRRRERGGGKHF